MARMLTLLALCASGTGAAAAVPLGVREVMEEAEALDGREILVSGWVEECRHLSCPLYASKNEVRRSSPRYFLSIGQSAWFDAFVRKHGPGRITLRAKFDARCVADPRSGVLALCADRVNSLNPLAIIR